MRVLSFRLVETAKHTDRGLLRKRGVRSAESEKNK